MGSTRIPQRHWSTRSRSIFRIHPTNGNNIWQLGSNNALYWKHPPTRFVKHWMNWQSKSSMLLLLLLRPQQHRQKQKQQKQQSCYIWASITGVPDFNWNNVLTTIQPFGFRTNKDTNPKTLPLSQIRKSGLDSIQP